MKNLLLFFGAILLLSAWSSCYVSETNQPQTTEPLVYSALLTQYGEENPTATVLENTFGNIVWTREYQGRYHGTLSGAFPSGKTFCFQPSIDGNNINESEAFAYLSRGGTGDYIILYVKDITLNNVDGFNDLAIKFIVYP